MNSVGGPELLIFLFMVLAVPALVLVAFYWVVRLAVRHGVRDAYLNPPRTGTPT
jgi:hypothetical protein